MAVLFFGESRPSILPFKQDFEIEGKPEQVSRAKIM